MVGYVWQTLLDRLLVIVNKYSNKESNTYILKMFFTKLSKTFL